MLDPGSSSLSHMIRFGTVSWVAVSSRYAVVLPDSDWQSFRTGFLLTTMSLLYHKGELCDITHRLRIILPQVGKTVTIFEMEWGRDAESAQQTEAHPTTLICGGVCLSS